MPAHSLVEVVDRMAGSHPGRTALTFPAEGVSRSWSELRRMSQTSAAKLRAAGTGAGDLVGIILPNDSRFVPLLLGAWRAGAAVAPMPLPGSFTDRAGYVAHVGAMLRDGDIAHVVHDDSLAMTLEELRAAAPRAHWIAAGAVNSASDAGPSGQGGPGSQTTPPEHWPTQAGMNADHPPPEALAVVQYTSGSTSSPKGVELTHSNLMAGLGAFGMAAGLGTEDTWGVWLPLFHDFGLISTLTTLAFGARAMVWPPSAFLRQPALWLADFARHRLTHYSGPNFSFDLMVDSYREEAFQGVDLSAWHVAINGAEAVSPRTIERFQARFEPHGLRPEVMVPGYGMAEATLAVAVPALGQRPEVISVSRAALAREGRADIDPRDLDDARQLVSVGPAVAGIGLRVVDQESGVPVPVGHVGEIELRGPAVTPGYRGGARRADGQWLRTGDLGFLRGESLFIVGRSKDTIILRGQNHHPEDIEPIVAAIPGVHHGRCAVVAQGEVDEWLAVVVETRAGGDALTALRANVRRLLHRHLGIAAVEVHLVAPRTIPRTSSGKVRRRLVREMLDQGRIADLEIDQHVRETVAGTV